MTSPHLRYLELLLQKRLHEEAFSVATTLANAGEYQQALVLYERLLDEMPDSMSVRYNYSMLLEKNERHAEAQAQYRMLFLASPDYGKGAIGYARMLGRDRRYADAVTALRQAVAASPKDPKVAAALGNSLIIAGEPEAALLWYGVALALSSDDKATFSNFLYTLLMVRNIPASAAANELQQVDNCPLRLIRLANSARQFLNFDGNTVATFHRNFGNIFANGGARWFPERQLSSSRVRIGYISADLCSHPVGYFLQGVLPNHDRQRWEVFVFSPYGERDLLTAKLKESAEHWVVLDYADRKSALRQIRECCLDIAVDMAGHTGGNYLDLFAKGLAGIQMTWAGYPGTTGLTAMDYIVADPVALPVEDAPYYSERPLYLANNYVCMVLPVDAPLSGPLPAALSGFVTFGSFNTVQKLGSSTIVLWAAVLKAIPNARIFLKTKGFDDPQVCLAFLEKFAGEGVSSDRLVLQGYSPRAELLEAYQQVDIALDPVPYQGGVTVLESLWMGVPTLVLQGGRPPFVRHAESHLVNVGLQDWIAVTEDDYVAKAVAFSRDLTGLALLRSRLRQQMAASPLCDTVSFTCDLEAAYERAWLDFIMRGKVS